MYCLARSTATSRASASRRLSRFAESCRASPSICLISSSLASSAVSPATRSSSCFWRATSSSYLAAAAPADLLALAHGALPRGQLLLESIDRRLAIGDRGLSPRERLVQGRGLLALRPCLALGVHEHVVRLFFGVEQRFLAAGVGVARGILEQTLRLLLGASDGLDGDALPAGYPRRKDGSGHSQRNGGVYEQSQTRQHA